MNILNILGIVPTNQKSIGLGSEPSSMATTAGQKSLFLPMLLQLFGGGAARSGMPNLPPQGADLTRQTPSDDLAIATAASNGQSSITSNETGLEFLASGNAFRGTMFPAVQACQYPDLAPLQTENETVPQNNSAVNDAVGNSPLILGLPAFSTLSHNGNSVLDLFKDLRKSSKVAPTETQANAIILQTMTGLTSPNSTAAATDSPTTPVESLSDSQVTSTPIESAKILSSAESMVGANVQQSSIGANPLGLEVIANSPQTVAGQASLEQQPAYRNQQTSIDLPPTPVPPPFSDRILPVNVSENGESLSAARIVRPNQAASSTTVKVEYPNINVSENEIGRANLGKLNLNETATDGLLLSNSKSDLTNADDSNISIGHTILTNIPSTSSVNSPDLSSTKVNLDDVTSIFISNNNPSGVQLPKSNPPSGLSKSSVNSNNAISGMENRDGISSALNSILGEKDGTTNFSNPGRVIPTNVSPAAKPADAQVGIAVGIQANISASLDNNIKANYTYSLSLPEGENGIALVPALQNKVKGEVAKVQETMIHGTPKSEISNLREANKTEAGSDAGKNPTGNKSFHSEEKRNAAPMSAAEIDVPQFEGGALPPKIGNKPAANKNSNGSTQALSQDDISGGFDARQKAEAVDSGTNVQATRNDAVVPSAGDGNIASHSPTIPETEISSWLTSQFVGLHNQQAAPLRSEINVRNAMAAPSNQANLASLPPGNLEQSILDQVSKNLALKFANNNSEVRITLKPESLGQVVMKVKMDEGKLTAQIDVNNVNVKAVLEANVPQLRDTLISRGIEIQRIDIVADGQAAFGSSSGQNTPKKKTQQREMMGADPMGQYDSLRTLGYNTMELIM